jgi:hypothetical protein
MKRISGFASFRVRPDGAWRRGVLAAALEAGFKVRTIEAARKRIGVESIERGCGEHLASLQLRAIRQPVDHQEPLSLGGGSFRSSECPRRESNTRTRFRRALLYPLSYGGRAWTAYRRSSADRGHFWTKPCKWAIRERAAV